ncbi:Gfo/Idh/MocA family protein [Hwanghaeella sp.]|uniref:Gfo/Idh/MocA family protein n=1 Tax=Hwanghaeella sp. TaxID=2605943 RepID=UPI003CCBB0F6
MAEPKAFTGKTAALIGAGRMGRSHALALRELGVTITAVCDRRPESVEKFATEFDVPADRATTDADRFFEDLGTPDILVIATTAETHCDLTCKGADAGARAILCEKPMATSVEDCETMLARCRKAGVKLAINHQMRFMDQYSLVKSELESGRLGTLASMNVVAGAFGLAMNGSHYIEAFHYLTGQWPDRVSAIFNGEPINNPRGPDFFDQGGNILFQTAGGPRLSLSIGHDQGHGMTVTYAGTWGHIFVDELQGSAIVTARKPEHRDAPNTRFGMPWDRQEISFPQADNVGPTKAVMEALLTGENYPDGDSGHRIVAALASSYASAEQGGSPVEIASNTDMHQRKFPWA